MTQYFNPITWLRWAGQFVSGWFLSLPLRDVPKSVPALTLLGMIIITMIASSSQTSDWRGRLMNRQLQAALDRDDFHAAELVLNRKLRRTPDDTELLYRLAVNRDALGEEESAAEGMQYLVTAKRDVNAASWLLQKKLTASSGKVKKEDAEEIGGLLELVHKERPKDIRIREMYAQYLIGSGKFTKALPLLDDLSRRNPMYGLTAAKLARNMGNQPTATRFAKRTLGVLMKRFEEEPSNASLAIGVVNAQVFLEQHQDAIKVLDRARALAKTDAEKKGLSLAMGDVVVSLVKTLEKTKNTSEGDHLRILKMLQFALRAAPNNPRVLTLVADRVLATMDQQDDQIRAIRKALVSGSSPGIAHFIRGTAALMNDDVERAQTSLELAAKQLPNAPAILNNLAVVLTQKDGGDLERALKLSESAIKQSPKTSPHFLETRGQILMRLKRYTDAIPDLEAALVIEALAPAAHQSLAICYEKIDEPEIAQMHLEAVKSP